MFFQNHLIELLPAVDRRELLTLCEPISLVQSDVLWHQNEIASHVYFPVQGLISLMAAQGQDAGLEVALIGNEGMLGARVALGVTDSPSQALVQANGWAWRLKTALFQKALINCPPLRSILNQYIAVRMAQLTTAATCLRYHEIESRLARWLLMHQDRLRSARLNITQDHLSALLGVRRVSITNAAGRLQQRKLIEYQRGSVLILDRLGLEAAACNCYKIDLSNYSKFMN